MKKVCQTWENAFPSSMGDHLFDEFAMRAKNVSAEVFRVPTPEEAKTVLIDLIKYTNTKKVVAVECPLQRAADIHDALREIGVELYTNAEEIAAQAESADLGISSAEFGVAETGSVLTDAYSIESRLVSTLPPIHVIFMSSDKIVPGITEAIGIISKTFDRGYLSFITGPSRTADIERVLTIGVHGPSRFIIIAVDAGGVM